MNSERALAKAAAWKRRSHRLSLDLRLKTPSDARKFLREHSVVLWNGKGELPNLLDAILGRIANGKERLTGRAAENCLQWSEQLLQEPEFLECRFFAKQPTALHQDLWPFATVFARLNRSRAEDGALVSRDAKRILSYLGKERSADEKQLKRVLKVSTGSGINAFQRAKQELLNLLIVVDNPSRISLELWEERMPKPVRARADNISEKEARMKLLAATLQSCVLSNEKRLSTWFSWCNQDCTETLEAILMKRDFLRIRHKKDRWIILRHVLSAKSVTSKLTFR